MGIHLRRTRAGGVRWARFTSPLISLAGALTEHDKESSGWGRGGLALPISLCHLSKLFCTGLGFPSVKGKSCEGNTL